jgi:uncharacterized protein YggE
VDRRLLITAVAAVAAVAALLVGLALGRSLGESDDGRRTISVTGSGSVEVVPDEGVATFGVSATAQTAAAARAASDRRERRVIATLKAHGIADADIQTSDVSLSPRFSPNGRRIVGYTASNSVTATIRDLGEASTIIPAAVAAGANEVSGLSLSSSEEEELYAEALGEAVEDARGRAEALAAASVGELGEVVSVTESGDMGPIPFEAATKAADQATPIEPGTVDVTADVTVVFELQ